MKKLLSLLMTIAMTLMLCTSCMAAENGAEDFTLTMQIDNPIMTVNGAEKEIDEGRGTTPVIVNDRTLVPIRAIIEEMGGTVSWEQSTQTAALNYNSDTIDLVIGSTTAYFNGTANTLDVSPAVINERTMLPIRFIAESFKFAVDWDGSTQTITIARKTDNSNTEPTAVPSDKGKTLVVYYSASGTTERVANHIKNAADADIFELEPVNPYTSTDLNYGNSSSRVVYEHEHSEAQDVPLVSTSVPNWNEYDTVYIGYPIWWHSASWVVYNFVKYNDFTGKTVIPFSTSASSGEVGADIIKTMTSTGNWLDGRGFRSSESRNENLITTWVDSLNLK